LKKAKPFEISKEVVLEAWKQVKANHGAADVDEESIEDFEEDLKKNLYKIWRWDAGRTPDGSSTRQHLHAPTRRRTSWPASPASTMRWRPPCAGMEPDQRRRFRQEHAAPLLAGIFAKLEEMRLQTTPLEPLRKAIDYALNQRTALCRYLEDGRLRPDNNLAENAMRPVALGRKNWLFVGSQRGGRAAALFMGLIASCKAREINPWEYFDDMLRRIMSHPVNRLRELLPDKWEPLPKHEQGMILAAKA